MQKILMALVFLLTSTAVSAGSAALLVYKVWEQGAEPYIARILVTPTHMRLDEGSGENGFTLFDRRERIIYNVSPEDHSVLVIQPRQVAVAQDEPLVLSEKKTLDSKAPKIAGVQPVNVELQANGESCAQLVVVPGLMEPALAALREFRQVLAGMQAQGLASRPEELQTPCDLATNVQAPTRSLDHGLPIQERSEGRAQMLLDYAEQHEVDDRMFELPKGFQQITLPGA